MSRLRLTAPALLVTLIISWPALQHGLIDETLPMDSMLIRVGVAMLLTMIGQAFLSSVIDAYRLQNIVRRNRQEAGALEARDDEGRKGS